MLTEERYCVTLRYAATVLPAVFIVWESYYTRVTTVEAETYPVR